MLGYPVYKVLKYAEVPSSTWYDYGSAKEDQRKFNKGRPIPGYSYDTHGNKIVDKQIIAYVRIFKEDPHFANGGGHRKIKWYLLRHYGIKVNHKKLYRLLKEENLLLPSRKKKRAPRKICINRIVSRPNQLWEFDIKYGYIHGEDSMR